MSLEYRNLAIVGHGTCGKTTLVEELLVRAGAIPRAGKVEEGSSILDHDSEEKERRFTIDATPCHLKRGQRMLQIIDTPGYPDFIGAVLDSFAAIETAVIAVDAHAGIRVNTRRVWKEAGDRGLARMIIVTRLDQENTAFEPLVEKIREAFGARCIPLFLPDATGPGVSRVEGTYHLSGDASEQARDMHGQLVEAIVESDEELMERYLAEEEIASDEIDRAFASALLAGTVVPILCCSVAKDVGVAETLDMLLSITPAHDAAVPRPLVDAGGEAASEQASGPADAPLLARVFKVVSDPFVGKLTYLRIFAGTLEANMQFHNLSRGAKERAASLLRPQGKEQLTVDSAGPGEIVAIPKLESALIGDTFSGAPAGRRFAPIRHPVPMVKLAVEPKSRNDETKIGEALRKLDEADGTFEVKREKATRELVIAGLSTLHLEVMLSRMRRRFQLEVETRTPKTPYKESITGRAEGHHKHKKQTGGRGQYGEVYIRLEPAEPGTALEFVDNIVGGAIPNQFIPAVEKGIRETMEAGILAGFPVEGCKVTLYDGTFHSVDSSEQAFKTAAREAFKSAFLGAKPCLLEPIVDIEIQIPSQYMGDITGDLNSRRGRISGMDSVGEMQVIRAQVPEAEIKNYSTELRSLTGGEASYAVSFSHYDVVPASIRAQVIERVQKESSRN